jgi:hypothetical protein
LTPEAVGGGDSADCVSVGAAGGTRRGRRLVKPAERTAALTAQQRLLLLDTWLRSKLPTGDFAALIGMSKHTL